MQDTPVRIVLITGAGGGIGAAAAARFCGAGDHVWLADINARAAAAQAERCRSLGCSATPWVLDVGDEAGWQTLEDEIRGRHGRLDACVLAAGIGDQHGILEMPLAGWRRVLATNLDGVMLGTRTAGRIMRDTGVGGSIIAVSSILGYRGSDGYAAYCAAKAGIHVLVKCAALETSKLQLGIRVNSISPGMIDTSMLQTSLGRAPVPADQMMEAAKSTIPLGQLGTVEQVAEAIFAMCGPGFSYMTGADVVLDGGLLAKV